MNKNTKIGMNKIMEKTRDPEKASQKGECPSKIFIRINNPLKEA